MSQLPRALSECPDIVWRESRKPWRPIVAFQLPPIGRWKPVGSHSTCGRMTKFRASVGSEDGSVRQMLMHPALTASW